MNEAPGDNIISLNRVRDRRFHDERVEPIYDLARLAPPEERAEALFSAAHKMRDLFEADWTAGRARWAFRALRDMAWFQKPEPLPFDEIDRIISAGFFRDGWGRTPRVLRHPKRQAR